MSASLDPRSIRVRDGRPPQGLPAMSNAEDQHATVRLTSRWIEVAGEPVIPVSGELHYARVPRERWEEDLRLLLASGITLVSTYVFWIHHEPVRGAVSFEGDLDLGAFLETADRVGIDVVLRIGPWSHGESRNGGFPDWVQALPIEHRSDDPAYLELVTGWYASIAEQAARFCGPDGRIVGIQIENELYDQPEHLATLKRLAREAGLTAPLWTATAWGGAQLPEHELFPLYSGYADGFWAGQGSNWDDSFRDHFAFTHVWDDPGVGGDFREEGVEITVRGVDPEFPPATCELGGGMATAYHRRPLARGADIAAVANVKLGNGSLWQGFYMFTGGVNPRDHLQESHATGYPNDMPRFDYDFQGAFGATGQPGPSLPLLREHNAFVAAFGGRLADWSSSLPESGAVDVHDLDTLRWAVRSGTGGGVIFVNTHQPYEPLHAAEAVQLRIAGDDGETLVPDRPIGIPSGVIGRWPFQLELAGARIEWATASLIGIADGELPTLVLRAHDGLPARFLFASGSRGALAGETLRLDGPVELQPGDLLEVDGSLRVLLVGADLAERLWFLDGAVVESTVPVWQEDGRIVARASSDPAIRRWDGAGFAAVELRTASSTSDRTVSAELVRESRPVPARYGEHMGRSSAPDDRQVDEFAAVWRVTVPEHEAALPGDRVELVLGWEGDVAQLRADGVVIGDRFWDGLDWRIDIGRIAPGAELTLHIVPISTDSVVDLDADVRARLDAAGSLCSIRELRRIVTGRWTTV